VTLTERDRGRLEAELADRLRGEVLAEISRLRLDPDALAERLDLVPTATRALLIRKHWPLQTALTLAEGLQLPISLRIDHT
jgi:hypothetical protein